MYRIMLVDDEEPVRIKITELIKRSGLKLEVAAEARNGKQAIQQLNEVQGIDIIITDVRMPVMDGLSLIENVKPHYPGIKFAVVSGYAEFEYAKRAMALGVSDYILKPVKRDNLFDVLNKIILELDEKENVESALKKAENTALEYRKAFLQKYLGSLLLSSSADDNRSRQLSMDYPELKFDNFSLILLQIKRSGHQETNDGMLDFGSIKMSIGSIIKDAVEKIPNTMSVDDCINKNEVIIIIGENNTKKLIDKTNDLASDIYSTVKNSLGVEISIGVDVSNGLNIKSLYKNARIALNNRFFYESRFYYYSGNIKSITTEVKRLFDSNSGMFKLVQNCVSNNNLSKLPGVLKGYVGEVFNRKKFIEFGAENLTIIFIEFANFLSGVFIKCGIPGKEIFNSEVESEKVLSEFNSFEDIISFFETIIDEVFLDKDVKSVVEKAVDYVKQNFQQDISLTAISKIFAINACYFSRVFKYEMGINFTDYVTKVKVEKAKELLASIINVNILDVALTVGYNNQQYFNRVFKKVTGITPSEYRNICRNSVKLPYK